MENSFYEKLKEFLYENGVEEMPSNNKDIYKEIKKILFNIKVNEDHTDLIYSKGNSGLTRDEYLEKLEKINENFINGTYYKVNIKNILKEEKKEKIKSIFRKK